MDGSQTQIARLEVSPARRAFGIVSLGLLGGLMIFVALVYPSDNLMSQVFLLLGGALMLIQVRRFYHATAQALILTRQGLYDGAGRELCQLTDITRVDRGFFAFKPSNGFLIRVRSPQPRAWVPGLWWRFGRSIGVGGATSAHAGRQMADMISLLISDIAKDIPDLSD